MPSPLDQLRDSCIGLSSTKKTERKKCAEQVLELMDHQELITLLNENQEAQMNWDNVVKSIHLHFIKEADKLYADECKKGSRTFYQKSGHELLGKAARKANIGMTRLTVSKLIEYVLQCFKTVNLKKYYASTYTIVLRDCILSNSRYHGEMEKNDWISLLNTLKLCFNEGLCDDCKIIECLELLLKWGPKHKLPLAELRSEFTFITKLCLALKRSSSKTQQEVVLKILVEFCNQQCKDCRTACCVLGETVFPNLQSLYELRTNDSTIKNLLIEFFLLQVKLHHPMGSPQSSTSAYAYSWPEWNKQQYTMYYNIKEEIKYNLISNFKSNSLFICDNKKRVNFTFGCLAVDVLKQICNHSNENTGGTSPQSYSTKPPCAKKARVETGMAAVISDIQEHKSWQWINIMAELLRKYPEIIVAEDFFHILQLLCGLQSECKDSDVLCHIYECFYVLVDVQKCVDVSAGISELDRMWSVVWDSNLRSAGLNQNVEATHKLLQKLLSQQKVQNVVQLFEAYASGVLAVSRQSLITFSTAASIFGVPEQQDCNISIRQKILNWILNIENNEMSPNTDIYSEAITADILVLLCLKQWPLGVQVENLSSKKSDAFDVQNMCMINAVEHELILLESVKLEENIPKSYIVNNNVLDALFLLLKNLTSRFVDFNDDEVFFKDLLNTLNLVSSTLSFLIKYNMISTNRFDEAIQELQFKEMFINLENILSKQLNVASTETFHSIVIKHFNALMCVNINCFVSIKIRDLLRIDILQKFYNFVDLISDDDLIVNSNNSERCLLYMELLCNFCYVKDSETLSEIQKDILMKLSESILDVENCTRYKMVMIFISSLKNYVPGTIPDEVLQNILRCIEEICAEYYTQCEAAVNILKVLRDMCIHIAASNGNVKECACALLQKFYGLNDNYGPSVSVVLIQCMGQIAKMDPVGNWSTGNGNCIALLIPSFLTSPYEEVRLIAIRNLLFLFAINSYNDSSIYLLQKTIFDNVKLKLRELFQMESEQSAMQHCKIDLTHTRTATVLHTYGALMVTNSMVRRKALYAVIELVHEKNLNADFLCKLLSKVVKNLRIQNIETYLNEHIDYLLRQWHVKYPLANFHYEFLGCTSEMQFYDKYLHIVVPILVQTEDVDTISSIARYTGKSVSDIVEVSYPKIIANCFLKHNFATNDGNKTFTTLQDLLSTIDTNELLLSKIDDVITNIIRSLFDTDEFKAQFGIQYHVTHDEDTYFTLMHFKAALDFIKETLKMRNTIIEFCITNYPNKIQKVLLNLTVSIHKSSGLEDKLRAMHHYAIFIDLLTPLLLLKDNVKVFLVKHILHSLLHIITGDSKIETAVNVAACKYFKKFCANILPKCAVIMESFLIAIVNKLIPIAASGSVIGQESLNVLDFLIVRNTVYFKGGIETLDPFPRCEVFKQINQVYDTVKYAQGKCDLQGEIRHFLRAGNLMGNVGCRTEALRCLKNQLTNKKDELKLLYDDLHNVRSFSEDCKDNVLHQLVSMLVHLTTSSAASESIEATRCLSELGPSDLTTIILEPQNTPEDIKNKPLEFVTVHIIELLCGYALDANIEVVQMSHQTLYDVLDTKEGKKFIDTYEEYTGVSIDTPFLIPFLTNRKIRSDSLIEIDVELFEGIIDDENLWCSNGAHDLWIRTLVCTLLKCFTKKSFLSKLIPMCEVKVSFCEKLFPYLIYIAMYHGFPNCVNIISKCMDKFFDMVWNFVLENKQVNNTVQQSSVQCMLNAVHFVRLQIRVNRKTIGHLTLDYLKVAQAAYFCSAYFAALLYVELWCQTIITKLYTSKQVISSNLTMLDVICEYEDKETSEVLQKILRQAYTALNDLDGLNGCGYMHLLDTKTRVDHYKELGRWEQVVLHYDIQTAHGSQEYFPELTDALKSCRLYQLAQDYNKSRGEIDYECFWRLNQYSGNNKAHKINSDQQHEKYKCDALKSLCENDDATFSETIMAARKSTAELLKHVTLENTKTLYNSFTYLQCIQELEDLYAAKQNDDFDDVFEKWKRQDKIGKYHFKYLEPVKAQRISMLTGLLKSGNTAIINPLIELYLDLSATARSEHDFYVAKRAVGNLSLLADLPDKYKAYKMFEEAQICWSINDKRTGRYIINQLFKDHKDNLRLYFKSLKMYGMWMVETRSENPQTIIANYFFESLKVMRSLNKTPEDCEAIFDMYDVIARFVDGEYQRILSYTKSSEFERKMQNMEKARKTATKIEVQCTGRPNEDERRAIVTYKKQSVIDETEIESTYKEIHTYCLLAMKYYLLNLQYSDYNNMRIFRVVSLLLENRIKSDILKLFKEYLPNISSHKFIPILPQLVPHLSNCNEEDYGKQIYLIIERCAREHPHHTLPILLALANSNEDNKYCKVVTSTESNEPRVLGAQTLIKNLQQEPSLKKLITDMENLSAALLELAYLDGERCTRTQKGNVRIPDRAKIQKMDNLSNVLLPTCTLNIKKNCDYADIVGIHSFGKDFVYVGGINAPKKITCRGTDGIVRTQLVKGKDDLRQDAVMQQVFTIMNGLLRSNKQTSKLLIRTYKVVPLSKRSGLIEWVENSMTIGDYLTDAHKKYNKGDWTPEKCRVVIKEVQRKTNDEKLEKFKEVCNNFRPVMHKFFETMFPQPTMWYEKRRAYMHSVATSSMCGYILGLGDRHVLNILLDKTTAEVIHIDFGIAFEQGRVLPTPETVPFRLTRDIENAMGVSGIEGVFRKSCEKTMEVLRQNSETIMTILEVLLYDPLYAWTVTSAEAYSRQFSGENTDEHNDPISFSDEDKIPVNITAERALLKLQQKLQGTEEGSTSSVEGQVEKMLQQARDFTNLSRLYFGWQAFF